MGISEKMNNMTSSFENGIKLTMKTALTLSLRIITGLFIGLTISLIFQELMQYGTFSFFFVILVCFGLFYKMSATWSAIWLLLFNLFFILLSLILRMYVLVAPNM